MRDEGVINNGDGTFAAEVDYPTGGAPSSLAVADLNGDGKPDLAIGDYEGAVDDFPNPALNNVSVLMNAGDGTFVAHADYLTGQGPNAVVAADLDGDGKPDLGVASTGANTVSVLVNKGDGTFAAPVAYTTGLGPASIAVADLNGDGRPDLAIADASWPYQTVSVLLDACLP